MTHAKRLWSIWQALLSAFAWAFTRPSFRRFAEWITAMAINGEEHTITQSVLALERPADWKALESFAEYGAWHPDYVTASLTRLVETAPGRLWHGYHISAVDDTKVHRNSPDVWGTCTFHEYTARCPNRAPTVRAHNWVVLGALLDNPGQPPWCLPLSGRLYFRKSQLPLQAQDSDHTVVFRTKCELVVELIREQARITGGRHLGIFDGAYALRSVVRPLVQPEPGHPRIEFLTRLRPDARLYALPPPGCRANQKWGRRLPPPCQHWYLHNSQFFVTCSVARDWAAFNGGGSLVNFSVTMDRPQCEGPPHNEGSGEISTRAEGVVAHGVILLLHVDLENRIPRGLTLT